MNFLIKTLEILDAQMTTPPGYGWFHLLSWAIVIALTVFLCIKFKNPDERTVRRMILVITLITIALEIYKQINYSFSYSDGTVTYDYQWYAFPFQFCSMPMYVGLIAALVKNKLIHKSMCAFLATYSVFAGVCVMFYPGDVFTGTIGINIQTMFCHGIMIVMGVFLLVSGYVRLEHKTILRAIPVFSAAVVMAMIMNEIAHLSGLLERETFNMFFISPYCDPHLVVYSTVQQYVPFPWCVFIYIIGFSLAAYVILLAAMGIGKLVTIFRVKKVKV